MSSNASSPADLYLEELSTPGLTPLSLTLGVSECLTLAGPSGCGKTRLLRAIADLDPHRGEVRLGSRRRSATPAPVWRQWVGFLPAESYWWDERVGDHFESWDTGLLAQLALPAECREWEIQRLSSGERQRLSLLRLLAGNPRVLLLDEPTANLDLESGRRVEALIKNYRDSHQAPVIWVSHDAAQRRRVGTRGLRFMDGHLEPEAWN